MTLETRICNRCGRSLPLAMFTTDTGVRSGRGAVCRPCEAERSRRNHAEHGDVYNARRRERYDPEKRRAAYAEKREALTARRRERYAEQHADRRERLASCAEAYDASAAGLRNARIREKNRDRIREMDRTGAESVREGALRMEFSRSDCETTIRVMEEFRDEAIREMEKRTRLAPMGASAKGETNERRKAA